MPKYMCWDVEREDERDARPVVAASPQQAAERFAAERDGRAVEFPAESRVHVRTPSGVEVYDVELRSVPSYHARKRKGGA